MDKLEQQVREIISDGLGVDISRVQSQTNIVEELDADSLDVVELAVCLECEFEIEITDVEAEKIVTVSDAVELVRRLVGDS